MSNKNGRKLVSIFLAFCMTLSIIPTQNLITAYAVAPEETTPLTSVWREGRLGITIGGATTVSPTDGSVSITGAGARLSKATYVAGNTATEDNMYYSYVKAEGATVITAKLSGTNPVPTAGGMTGIAIREDGETTTSPYFAVYYDYGNKAVRYAYRNGGAASTAPYKAGASAVPSYTATYTDDVYVKIVLAPNSADGSTSCSVFLSTTAEFGATANKVQAIADFTPVTAGLFGTDNTTLKASDLIIEKPAVAAAAATEITPAVTAVTGKYFYNSAYGEIKPSPAGNTDFTSSVYGDTVSISQLATSGISSSAPTYILFPATSEFYTMSVDVNISSYATGAISTSGVFAGLFTSADTVANGQGGNTLSLRANAGDPEARGMYTKGTSAPYNYGAGGMTAKKYALNTTYNLSITNKAAAMDYTISGESIATPVSSACTWSLPKNFITSTDGTNVTINQPLRYGIAFAGVSCTIKNLTLKNSSNYIIYDMNDYYEVASQPPVAGGFTSATVNADRTAIDLAWTETTAAVGKGVYEIAYSTDGGATYTVAGQTSAKKYSFAKDLATNSYIFKVYGVYKSNTSTPQLSSAVDYSKPLPKVVVTAADNSGNVDLTWTASAGAASYDIYRTDSYTSSAAFVANVATTAYTDASRTKGPYYYYVIAKDATNTSNPSDNALVLVGGLNTGAVSYQLSPSVKLEGTLVYEAAATKLTFDAANDTVITNSQTVSGSANEAGTIYAVCGNSVQSKTVIADEKFTFTFALTQGRNSVDYYFVDGEKNITKKFDNFVYLKSYDYLVDAAFAGNNGDLTGTVPTYKTITAAIAAVPTANISSKVIFIKNGTYAERLDISTPYISLIGEDSDLTKIAKSVAVADATATGMTTRNVVAVQAAATGFTAENLYIENTYPYKNGSNEQCDALMLNADQAILTNVKLYSFQDTLLTYNQNARQVFNRCYITGNVDFIYGTSEVLFDDCDIVGRYTQYKADGCFLAPQTMKTSTYGYVFNNCRFTSEAGIADNAYRLARTYGEASAALFNNCYLGAAVRHADVLCFEVMNYPLSTARYYEYNSFGPGAKAVAGRAQVSSEYASTAKSNMFTTDFTTLTSFDYKEVMARMYGVAPVVVVKADYSAVNALIAAVNVLVGSDYVDFSAVTAAVAAVVFDLDATEQTKVNAMAADIDAAVKALVKKPVVTIAATNNAAATIVDNTAVIPATAKLTVEALTGGTTYDTAAALVKAEAAKTTDATAVSQFVVFEINLKTSTDVAITQLDGKVSVSLPIPASLDTTKTICVFRVEYDGSLTKLDTKIVEGKCVFETNHFSTYIVAEVADAITVTTTNASTTDTTASATDTAAVAVATSDASPIVLYALILGFSACAFMYASKKKRIRRVNR